MKSYAYKIAQVNKLAKHIYQVLLSPTAGEQLHYQAGQYCQILLPEWDPRPYSIANAPLADHTIELHIQHFPDNPYTTDLLTLLTTHDTIKLSGPYGKCSYTKTPSNPIILLAGGTGFAPIKAIIEAAIKQNDPRAMHLYWGAKTIDDLYDHGLASEWAATIANIDYTPVLQHPPKDWTGKKGLVHRAVTADYHDLKPYQVYAAGPYGMVFAALHDFCKQGFERHLLHADALDT